MPSHRPGLPPLPQVITTGSTITLSKVDELLQRLFNVEASCLVALCGCPEVAQLLATAEVGLVCYAYIDVRKLS